MTAEKAWKWLEMLMEKYDLFDTDNKALSMGIDALKKQVPMKPRLSAEQDICGVRTYICPACKKGITGTNIAKWCYHCGQKMNWEDYDETE